MSHPAQAQLDDQIASNLSGLSHYESFASHRSASTQLVLEAAAGLDPGARLCVLGAGNAYDLELAQLLERFGEVHLVDIDPDALSRAKQRAQANARSRISNHAPFELSGMFEHLERWARLQVTPEELMQAPARGAERIAAALPGPFDVVVSTCLLTQLQLQLLELLGDRHRLFGALRELLTLTHLRALAALTKPGGRALLLTDLCEASVFPAGRPRDASDIEPLFRELVGLGHVIYSSHPELLKFTLQDDPVLGRAFAGAVRSAPWLWQNGPHTLFLVYGLALERAGT
jgi:SAM-dependent methyltransferase